VSVSPGRNIKADALSVSPAPPVPVAVAENERLAEAVCGRAKQQANKSQTEHERGRAESKRTPSEKYILQEE
jgi:hypothetical protein